jgi:hypothetical protein
MGPFKALSTSLPTLAALVLLFPAAGLSAQEPPVARDAGYDAPAHISLVEGTAILERDGEPDDSPMNMPLLAGDRVRTRAGRVEILFADGSTLHLDHNSVIDLQSDELVRLIDGRIRLSIPGPSREVRYRVDGPQGWLTITEPGDYRLALMSGPRGSELEVAVLRGRAELANDGGQTLLRAGERAFARSGAAPSYAYVANSASWDAFDRWSEARRDERLRATATYLPDEVRPYAATLEQHGYWDSEPTYGAVWYPRVQSDWRPYYRGRWVSLNPYGWTWVAHDPWGWPTHHYGRWGHSPRGWYWIPGRRWGAAWVSWAYAGDYVSWCPLGWNNRPVFGLNININIGGGYYDPWRAWTVIPRRHFGYGYVHRHVVRADYLDHRTRSAFVYRDRAPEWGGRAVPRATLPIRVAGTRDGRRGTAPVYSNVPGDRARVTSNGQRVQVPDARPSRLDESEVPRGARPSDRAGVRPGPSGDRAVPRGRATPSGPAVRSQRAGEPLRSEAPSSSEPPRRYEVPVYRGGVRSDGTLGDDRPPAGARPSDRPASDSGASRAVPRAGSPRQEDRVEPAPVQRSTPGYGRAPRPEYSRPAGSDRQPPPAGDRPPSAEPGRPRAVERAPRGSDGAGRPDPGSYERRPGGGAASAPPARAEQPGRSGGATPPAGARPRGGASSGAAARPRGGG